MIRGSGALPLITRSICRIKNIIGFSIIAFVGGESTCVALFASKSKRKSEQRELLDTLVMLFPQYDGIINYPRGMDYDTSYCFFNSNNK